MPDELHFRAAVGVRAVRGLLGQFNLALALRRLTRDAAGGAHDDHAWGETTGTVLASRFSRRA
jgi:hypothetical protein